ncbi:restriction endonuclease subunit S [Endozoicomonas sp. ALE010]|uniref:restriction endonuclease subunit S n=1 Tax=Endozoicomonas sp. ALE010 TaxID=3403081 RepID=UPI003BB6C37A
MATLSSIIESHGGLIQTGPFGSQLKQAEYTPDGIPVVMPKDIIGGTICTDNIARVSEQKAEQLSRHALKAGSIIFPRRGDIGKCALITGETEGFLCGTGCIKIEMPPDKIDSDFLYYYLIQPDVTAWLENNAIGSTMLNLNTQVLGRLETPDLSLEQQKAISSVGKSYDLLIQNNHRRIQLLEESARLLYQEWFVHLRFPGHEHAKLSDGLPLGWEQKPLTDIAKVNEESLKKGFQERIEYIDISSVSTHAINETTWYEFADAPGRARRVLQHGDILWSCVRPNRRSHALVIEPHDRLIASTGFAVISAKTVSPYFLYQALTTNDYVGYLTNNASGAAYPAVTGKVFEKSTITVPSQNLIAEYDKITQDIYRHMWGLKQHSEKLAQARDLLLPRLMNGELTP